VRILDLDPPVSRTIQLAYRSASAERPAVMAVRDALLQVARGLELVSAAA
jgi:DNA-binding transcriptional LysR family regulator